MTKSARARRASVAHIEQPVPTFYYDLMSPYAYLAAARVDDVLPVAPVWQPVLLGALFKLAGRSSWAIGDRERRRRGIDEIERRAASYGLPPLRWPDPWPSSSLYAMRASIYARGVGREREFAFAAFGMAFGQGRDLGELRHVLGAAERAGLEPSEVETGIQQPAVKDELRAVSNEAHAHGVFGVPTLATGDELFWGDDRLEDAAARLTAA